VTGELLRPWKQENRTPASDQTMNVSIEVTGAFAFSVLVDVYGGWRGGSSSLKRRRNNW